MTIYLRSLDSLNKIVIHHSVTPRDLDFQKSLASFDNNHKQRLHQEKGALGYHIAYHYTIGGKGEVENTRALEEVGYHASNWEVNKTSIGICLTGEFDTEEPSTAQYEALAKLIKQIEEKLGRKLSLHGHNEYASKTCPGKNFDINTLLRIMNKPMRTDKDNINEAFELVPVQLKNLFSDYSGEEGITRKVSILSLYRFLELIIGEGANTEEEKDYKEESLKKLILSFKEVLKK